MNCHKTAWFTLAALLSVAGITWAQFGGRETMEQAAPPMWGEFKPTVGAGSEYQLTGKDRNTNFTMLVVGKETVDGAEGYWMEQRFEGGGMPGEMVQKQLIVMQDGKPDIKRMIMQPPGQQPMEMPVGMMVGACSTPMRPRAPTRARSSAWRASRFRREPLTASTTANKPSMALLTTGYRRKFRLTPWSR